MDVPEALFQGAEGHPGRQVSLPHFRLDRLVQLLDIVHRAPLEEREELLEKPDRGLILVSVRCVPDAAHSGAGLQPCDYPIAPTVHSHPKHFRLAHRRPRCIAGLRRAPRSHGRHSERGKQSPPVHGEIVLKAASSVSPTFERHTLRAGAHRHARRGMTIRSTECITRRVFESASGPAGSTWR